MSKVPTKSSNSENKTSNISNLDHFQINEAIKTFISLGKTQTVIIENKETKKTEKIEIPAQTKIPQKLQYSLMKNVDKIKIVEPIRDKIVKELKEIYEKDHPKLEANPTLSKKEQKEYDEEYENSFTKYVENSELYKNFLDDIDCEVTYHKLVLTEDKENKEGKILLEEIDPNGEFDITSIPVRLLNTLFSLD